MGRLFIIVGIVSAVFAGTANAASSGGGAGFQHEININGTAGSAGLVSIPTKGGSTVIAITAGYAYTLSPMFQIGIYPSFAYASTPSSTVLNALGGFTVNFDGANIQDSIFLFAAAGLRDITGTAKFALRGDLGKRFKVWEHVNYRPTAGILWMDGTSVVINVELLSASIQF
jgi:hypothetical protein